MDLALGGARADGSPADQAGDVLRRDHVEEFGAGGHAHLGQIEEQVAREAQAVVDLVGLIEIWIVDEALPADVVRGFSKYTRITISRSLESSAMAFSEDPRIPGWGRIVDRAGADDDKQAVVCTIQDIGDLAARLKTVREALSVMGISS